MARRRGFLCPNPEESSILRFSVTAKPLHYTFILGARNPGTPSPTKRPQTTRWRRLVRGDPSGGVRPMCCTEQTNTPILHLRSKLRHTPPSRNKVHQGLVKLISSPGFACRLHTGRNRFLVSCTSARRVSLPPQTFSHPVPNLPLLPCAFLPSPSRLS